MELVLVPLIAMLTVGATAFALMAAQGLAADEALGRVARRYGLRHERGTWLRSGRASGLVDGFEIGIDVLGVDGGGSGGTRVSVRHPALAALGFAIGSRRSGQELPVASGPAIEVGDPELDAIAEVRGSLSALLSRLGPRQRAAVGVLVREGGRVGDGACTVVAVEVVQDEASLEAMVRCALHAAQVVVEAGDESAAALCRRAEEDPVPEVRHRALAEAARHGASDGWLDRMSRTYEPEVILLAARARGEAGRERLWALVDHGHAPWPRRAAVALAAMPSDARRMDLESALLRCLRHAQDADVIDALGRIGSVRSVAPLRSMGGSTANRAVRAIQDRSAGVVGGLALADPVGGELALVDGQDREGRLSGEPEGARRGDGSPTED